jgi:phage baseplate assembly protein W
MGLTPDITIPYFDDIQTSASKTYTLNFETGEIKGMVDGLDAIKQFCIKTINTARFRHVIYSFNYGCEIEELIGMDLSEDFLKAEISRMVTEALEYDDRIDSVEDFEITNEHDNIYINFTVNTMYGDFTLSEVVKNV